jgi:hypothetical protein
MVDQLDEDPTPRPSPTLTEAEEARAVGGQARRHVAEWLMTADDGAEVEVFLASSCATRLGWSEPPAGVSRPRSS